LLQSESKSGDTANPVTAGTALPQTLVDQSCRRREADAPPLPASIQAQAEWPGGFVDRAVYALARSRNLPLRCSRQWRQMVIANRDWKWGIAPESYGY
jgi:hypothetical protein